jgi:putative membrane protein
MFTRHHTTSYLHLDVRDRLALERTRLANERTVLAYLRSALAIMVAGFSLMEFFQGNIFVWVGALLVPLGVGIAVAGWLRFRSKQARIHAHAQPPKPL